MDAQQKTLRTYLEKHFHGEYLLDEPLALHTWYHIGGPADFFVYPKQLEDVIGLLRYCQAHDVTNIYFMGEGANILASDAGYRGVIIHFARHFADITIRETTVAASAGVLLRDLVLRCEEHQLGGVEYLSGIPGTVGGALIMNAGTHQGEIGDHVSTVSLLNPDFEPIVLAKDQIHFGYRSAPELQTHPVLGCTLTLSPEKETELRARRLAQLRQRAEKQPLEYPSCGSVFKRPQGYYVGKMVQDLGLRGMRCGNAQIAEKHGGFILNLGNAKASEVLSLIRKVQEEVYKTYAVELEPEVRFLGF